jgi:hypothetical protein
MTNVSSVRRYLGGRAWIFLCTPTLLFMLMSVEGVGLRGHTTLYGRQLIRAWYFLLPQGSLRVYFRIEIQIYRRNAKRKSYPWWPTILLTLPLFMFFGRKQRASRNWHLFGNNQPYLSTNVVVYNFILFYMVDLLTSFLFLLLHNN